MSDRVLLALIQSVATVTWAVVLLMLAWSWPPVVLAYLAVYVLTRKLLHLPLWPRK